MAKDISDVTEEKVHLQVLLNQIYDYLQENVSVDSSPSIFMIESWDELYVKYIMGIRNSIAILMEDATEETKIRVKEELNS